MQNTGLSPWASGISPSPTLAVDAKAKALKAAGKDICGFGAGEPDFDTPEFIKDACVEALKTGQTKYAPAAGIPALREAVAEKYLSERGVPNIKPEQVVITPGGKFACYLAILATCGPGDEVIIPAPYWVSYPEMVKLAGASPKIIFASYDQEFKIKPEQLEAAITDKTRLLILNSPSNPTGSVYSRQELEALMDIALRHGLFVMSDEIYEYLLYDGMTHHSPASFSEEAAASTIIVGGFSKTYSMTGWRMGTLAAPPQIAKAIASIQSQTTSNATTFAQYGALEAVKNQAEAQRAIRGMLEVFDRRRLKLFEGLNAISGVSCCRAQGAFYLFPNIASFKLSSTDFSARLLEEKLVAAVPGIAFGDDSCIRLSYATSDEVIERGLIRIQEFCQELV